MVVLPHKIKKMMPLCALRCALRGVCPMDTAVSNRHSISHTRESVFHTQFQIRNFTFYKIDLNRSRLCLTKKLTQGAPCIVRSSSSNKWRAVWISCRILRSTLQICIICIHYKNPLQVN